MASGESRVAASKMLLLQCKPKTAKATKWSCTAYESEKEMAVEMGRKGGKGRKERERDSDPQESILPFFQHIERYICLSYSYIFLNMQLAY